MNFYKKHIGDFNNATRHLTRVERSLYSDAIELYYDTESVLTSDIKKLERLLLAQSDEEKSALKTVLDEYFVLNEDGYFHKRCDEEIGIYRANVSAKARAGIASANARKQKATRVEHAFNKHSTLVHNHKPLTTNHKPVTINKHIQPRALLEAENIPKNIINDFIAIRKVKKLPITQSAIDGIKKEALKLNYTLLQAIEICCAESWAGFKADWVLNKNKQSQAPPNRADFQQSTTEAAYEKLFGKRLVEKDISDEATRV